MFGVVDQYGAEAQAAGEIDGGAQQSPGVAVGEVGVEGDRQELVDLAGEAGVGGDDEVEGRPETADPVGGVSVRVVRRGDDAGRGNEGTAGAGGWIGGESVTGVVVLTGSGPSGRWFRVGGSRRSQMRQTARSVRNMQGSVSPVGPAAGMQVPA